MKRVLNAVLGGCLLVASCAAPKKDTITIKGKVQFPDNQFNMEIVERNGFDKTIIDSCKVNADGTYQFTMKVDRPGAYYLDCQKWQGVSFWAEDEDLEINVVPVQRRVGTTTNYYGQTSEYTVAIENYLKPSGVKLRIDKDAMEMRIVTIEYR